ncbi:uncharacterized protein [Antennarius striatus]|uniref:uncharacterized protein n=1 Tax=Antennarius striatus TaxID=241820 RepID=UPI0035B309B6
MRGFSSTPVMSSRLTFHLQLASIMETMTRSVLSQVYQLVDEDSGKLRLELSRLLEVNSTLADRVRSLECELTAARRDAPETSRTNRSVGVQTAACRDGEAHAAQPPTIAGIFGKDWCMNLWKDRDPDSLDRVPPQSPEEKSVAPLPDHTAVAEVTVDSGSCQEATLNAEEHEEILSTEPQLSIGYQTNNTFSMSFDQDEEQILSVCVTEDPSVHLLSINDTEEAFTTYMVPIEEDDDDDVQFVEESQQEPLMNDTCGSGHNEQQTLPSDICQNSSAQDKGSQETSQDPNRDKFTCSICSRSFFHRGTLTHHMKSHRSTFCNICKQYFPKREKMISHTCVPPVPKKSISRSCELCGKTFANQSALRIHYVVHTGEKPYRCGLCGKGFTQKGNLKCHLRIHTGERPFRCVRCGKTFTQKVNLNHHLMAHRYREVVAEKSLL